MGVGPALVMGVAPHWLHPDPEGRPVSRQDVFEINIQREGILIALIPIVVIITSDSMVFTSGKLGYYLDYQNPVSIVPCFHPEFIPNCGIRFVNTCTAL
jgi:hypothetical protein